MWTGSHGSAVLPHSCTGIGRRRIRWLARWRSPRRLRSQPGFCGRKYPKFAVGILPALVICAVGAGAHLLLDMLNGYGVKLLWPFSAKWYAWDLADSVDSWILFFLIVGLLVPELFRLVHEEIGSKPKAQRASAGSDFRIWCALRWSSQGGRFSHQRAIALLDSREYREQTPLRGGGVSKAVESASVVRRRGDGQRGFQSGSSIWAGAGIRS